MRRTVSAGLVFVLMMAASGCGGADDRAGGDQGAGSEPRDSSTGEESAATTGEVPPLADLVVVRDEAAAVEATIGIEGGSLVASSGDGAVWTLDVPRGALAADTVIRAVPAILEGVEVPSWTLMFEPSGLFFYEFATLTIVTPVEVPIEEQFAFSLDDGGSALGAAPMVVDSVSPTLLVGHFSGYGLAQATPPERAALLERRASDAEARIQSQVGEAIGELRQAIFAGEDEPFDFGELMTMAFEEYERDVVKPRLEAASASCEATQRAVQTVLGYERNRALLGFETSTNVPGMEFVISTLQPGGKCEEEAIRQCIEAKDPSILIRFLLGAERARALLGSESSSLDGLISRAKKICTPTRPAVRIAGPVTFSLMGLQGTAVIDVTLTPDPDGAYTGTAEAQITGALNAMQTTCTSATWTESIDLMATLTTENDEQVLIISTVGEAPRGTPVPTKCTTAGIEVPSQSPLISSSLFGEVRIRVVNGDQDFVDTIAPGTIAGTVAVTVS